MKNYLLGFISCLILVIVVGVSAAIAYDAKDISFTSNNNDWNVTNVEDAIVDLYNNGGSKVEEAIVNRTYYNGRITNNATSADLEKGKYTCEFISFIGTTVSSVNYDTVENSNISISGCDNLDIKHVYDKAVGATNKIDNTSRYEALWSIESSFICEVNEAKTISVTRNTDAGAATPIDQYLICNKLAN